LNQASENSDLLGVSDGESRYSRLELDRLRKIDELRQQGVDPYPARVSRTHEIARAIELYTGEEAASEAGEDAGHTRTDAVHVAGRVMARRGMGKMSFLDVRDGSGQIQVQARADVLDDEFGLLSFLDIGDFVSVSGPVMRTRRGQISVEAQSFEIISKSIRPLPEKWHGLRDSEQIYRNRHLDLIVNEESRERFRKRSAIISCIRRFLESRDFMEVETSTLHGIAGGAAARPFTTHFNALDCDFHLRIALELHLKRLLVGGFDRVFEIGRVYRNEGLDRRHNPEFTMLEIYQAYSDYRGMMELIHSMVQTVCHEVLGSTTVVNADGVEIELAGAWREAPYLDLIREATGDSQWHDRSKGEKLAAARRLGLELNPELEDFEVTNQVFEKRVEPQLIQPTFVTHIPRELCPLAKLNEDDPTVLDVFELCIDGVEIAPAYSEQNDPFVQKEMFEQQVGEETQNLDHEFIAALEQGMPPAGGMGVGIG